MSASGLRRLLTVARLWVSPMGRRHGALLAQARSQRRRAGRALGPTQQVTVQQALDALGAARQTSNAQAQRDAAASLQIVMDRHLGRFAKPAWRQSCESMGGAILVALVLRCFVMEAFKIPSGSMIPTLAIGDQIFVNKYIYGPRLPFTTQRLVTFACPKRGEVIVFVCPKSPNEDYIKRVVGLPGDTIAVRDSIVWLDGVPVARSPQGVTQVWEREASAGPWWQATAEAFTEKMGGHAFTVLHDPAYARNVRDFGPYVVPAGHIFVMGDNRDHSEDSRVWGPVPMDNILGRAMFVWGTWGHAGISLKRVGTSIE